MARRFSRFALTVARDILNGLVSGMERCWFWLREVYPLVIAGYVAVLYLVLVFR